MEDGHTFEFHTTPAFDRGLAGLIHSAGLNAKDVIQKETGELIKTLVRVSMPLNLSKANARIKGEINRKFTMVGSEKNSAMERSGTVGASGIKWYRVDSDFLRGVAPQADKRTASAKELAPLRWRITKAGRTNLPFKHPRERQRVLLYQTILTKRATVNQIVRSAQANLGRRAAGWLVSVGSGIIRLTGANLPPKSVTRHTNGARGTFINGLDAPAFPRFTIINTAKGITARGMAQAVRSALAIRAKAMQKNALLFMSGKKRLADYAR